MNTCIRIDKYSTLKGYLCIDVGMSFPLDSCLRFYVHKLKFLYDVFRFGMDVRGYEKLRRFYRYICLVFQYIDMCLPFRLVMYTKIVLFYTLFTMRL